MAKPTRPYEQALAELINDQVTVRGTALARQQGPPPQAAALSDAEQLRLWMLRDNRVDPQQLATEGMTPSQITLAMYPYRKQLITNGKATLTDQIDYAERMAKKEAQQLARNPEPDNPEPPLPAGIQAALPPPIASVPAFDPTSNAGVPAANAPAAPATPPGPPIAPVLPSGIPQPPAAGPVAVDPQRGISLWR